MWTLTYYFAALPPARSSLEDIYRLNNGLILCITVHFELIDCSVDSNRQQVHLYLRFETI